MVILKIVNGIINVKVYKLTQRSQRKAKNAEGAEKNLRDKR